jgi:ABC-type multidrug transport system permease subunit
VAFLNNAITPIAFASRGVAYKHTSAGLFSEYSLNLAVLAGHLPISIVANAIFATILYFLVGFDGAGGRWAFFVLVSAACRSAGVSHCISASTISAVAGRSCQAYAVQRALAFSPPAPLRLDQLLVHASISLEPHPRRSCC